MMCKIYNYLIFYKIMMASIVEFMLIKMVKFFHKNLLVKRKLQRYNNMKIN